MFVAYEGPEITPLFGHDDAGAAANRIALAEHTGTHLDAPFHFDRDGLTVEHVAADALLLRPYKKFDLSARAAGPGELLDAAALAAAAADAGFTLEPGDVAIVEMGWDRHWPGAPGAADAGFWGRNEPGLSEDACRYLAEAGVAAVASDTAGCDVPCVDGEIGHGHGHSSWFLPRGILIVEGLRGLGGGRRDRPVPRAAAEDPRRHRLAAARAAAGSPRRCLMRRALFTDEQDSYRESFRRFLAERGVPSLRRVGARGNRPARALREGGRARLRRRWRCPSATAAPGIDDFRFNVVVGEEAALAQVGGFGARTDAAQRRLPALPALLRQRGAARALAAGDRSRRADPGDRDDRARHRLRPRRDQDDGDPLRRALPLNGAKTFITNGINADLIIVAVKTDPQRAPPRRQPAARRARNGGLRARPQPREDRPALAGHRRAVLRSTSPCPRPTCSARRAQGFRYLMSNLAQERVSIAIGALGAARAGLATTLEYVRGREAFGKPIGSFQNTRFQLAECHAEIEVAQAYLDRCVEALGIARADAGGRGDREVVVHRGPGSRARSLRPAARGLRLHGGVRGRAALGRRPRDAHLRRHERDHARDHRALARASREPRDRRTR